MSQYFSWMRKGGFAVLDQALFAGTNFLVGILLARWLGTASYGAYSTTFSVFLLISSLHTSLWIEPMLVYGSGRFQKQFNAYQKILLVHHWYFGLVSFSILGLLSSLFFVLNQPELGRCFLGLAIASPLILYLWLIRRSCYVLLKPQYAVLGGGIYLIVYLGIAFIAFHFQMMNETLVFCIMGFASFLAAKVVQFQIKNALTVPTSVFEIVSYDVRWLHLNYGKWALVAGMIYWVPGNLMFLLLPLGNGLDSSGILTALFNIILPLSQFNAALGNLLLPVLVRAKTSKQIMSVLYRFVIFQSVMALFFWLLLGIFHRDVIRLFYQGRYESYSHLLWYLGLSPLITGLVTVLGLAFRALERPKDVFWAFLLGMGLTLPVYILLNLYYGVMGAIGSLLLSFSSISLVLGIRFWKMSRKWT